MVICKYCRHFRYDPNDAPAWYNAHCRHEAVRLEAMTDPIFGETKYRRVNDLGKLALDDLPFPTCIEINPEGDCKLFEKK